VKRVVAIVALGAALVLAGVGRGGNTSAPGHGILLLGADNDAARIFLWRPGSPVKPLIGPQRWGLSGGGDFFAGMSDGFWSPTGRLIAYEQDGEPSLAPPDPAIYVMRSDGTHSKFLSSGDGDGDGEADGGRLPSWSPDGRQIVWHREVVIDSDYDYGQQFVIVDVRSGHERVWPADSATGDPVWGKPGIAYFSGSGIMLLNPTTGESRVVTSRFHGGKLAWSPGGVLAVGERRRIVLLAASGRVVGRLPLPPKTKRVCAIAWAPKRKHILVATAKGNLGLWVGTVRTKHWKSLSPVPMWRNYRYDTYGCAISWR
jgi:hypothetical protein